MDIVEVEYSHKKIKDELIMILKLLYDSYNYEASKSLQTTSELLLKLKQAVVLLLSQYSYVYKSSEYAEEREMRLIFTAEDHFLVQLPKDKKEGLYYSESNTLNISLSPEALYYCTQDLEFINDFRLNKPEY